MQRFPDSRLAAPIAALGVGVVLGSVLRNTPVAIANSVFAADADDVGRCGMEEAAGCAIRDTPLVIIEVARFGLWVLAVAALLALAGVLGMVWGSHRLRTGALGDVGDANVSSTRTDEVGLGLLAGGIAFVMPALWLAASFVSSIAG